MYARRFAVNPFLHYPENLVPVCDPYKTARNNGIRTRYAIFIVSPLSALSVSGCGIIFNATAGSMAHCSLEFEPAYA
jgi:hypothetical protein